MTCSNRSKSPNINLNKLNELYERLKEKRDKLPKLVPIISSPYAEQLLAAEPKALDYYNKYVYGKTTVLVSKESIKDFLRFKWH